MDEFVSFAQHLTTLKTSAFECQATAQHAWKRRKTRVEIVDGKKQVRRFCECGTEKVTSVGKDGRRKSKYEYPEGYRRDPGCGPRTADLNTFGFAEWMKTLPVVVEA